MTIEPVASCDQPAGSDAVDECIEFVTDPQELLHAYLKMEVETNALIFRMAAALVAALQTSGMPRGVAIAHVIAEYGVDIVDHSQELAREARGIS